MRKRVGILIATVVFTMGSFSILSYVRSKMIAFDQSGQTQQIQTD